MLLHWLLKNVTMKKKNDGSTFLRISETNSRSMMGRRCGELKKLWQFLFVLKNLTFCTFLEKFVYKKMFFFCQFCVNVLKFVQNLITRQSLNSFSCIWFVRWSAEKECGNFDATIRLVSFVLSVSCSLFLLISHTRKLRKTSLKTYSWLT